MPWWGSLEAKYIFLPGHWYLRSFQPVARCRFYIWRTLKLKSRILLYESPTTAPRRTFWRLGQAILTHRDPSWNYFGPSFVAMLAHLGAMLAHLGAMLAHLGAMLAHLGAMLAHLAAMLAHLEAMLACLGASWVSLGLCWANLDPVWGLCWATFVHLGPS